AARLPLHPEPVQLELLVLLADALELADPAAIAHLVVLEVELELHAAPRAVARERRDAHAVLALAHRHEAREAAIRRETHVRRELAGAEVREHHVFHVREAHAL